MEKKIKRVCANCEWNLADLISQQWCTKHDIERLPLFGCGDWRPRPDLNEAVEQAPMREA